MASLHRLHATDNAPLASPTKQRAVKKLFARGRDAPRQARNPADAAPADVDPNIGMEAPARAQHSHYCMLFKPQIVLKSDLDDASVIILGANDASIQSMDYYERAMEDDPVNAYMFTRFVHLFV